MPLLDHFHPPLAGRRSWHAFHNAWATLIAVDLNGRLPEGYFAEPNVQFGIEIDVATLDEWPGRGGRPDAGWAPPAPSATIPLATLTDTVEVSIFADEGGRPWPGRSNWSARRTTTARPIETLSHSSVPPTCRPWSGWSWSTS